MHAIGHTYGSNFTEYLTFGMNSVMDKIVDANELCCAWIKLCSWMITTHAFDHIDEFWRPFDGGRNWSPYEIGCKDLKWTKRTCIEKNNEIC